MDSPVPRSTPSRARSPPSPGPENRPYEAAAEKQVQEPPTEKEVQQPSGEKEASKGGCGAHDAPRIEPAELPAEFLTRGASQLVTPEYMPTPMPTTLPVPSPPRSAASSSRNVRFPEGKDSAPDGAFADGLEVYRRQRGKGRRHCKLPGRRRVWAAAAAVLLLVALGAVVGGVVGARRRDQEPAASSGAGATPTTTTTTTTTGAASSSTSGFPQIAVTTPSPSDLARGTVLAASFTYYGSGDYAGSARCNTAATACGFSPSAGYAAAVSQNLFGAGPGQGAGVACGTCWSLRVGARSWVEGMARGAVVVLVDNLCPAAGNPLCGQKDLDSTNYKGAVVDFNLCVDSGAQEALFGSSGVGLAVGNATRVDCSEWKGQAVPRSASVSSPEA